MRHGSALLQRRLLLSAFTNWLAFAATLLVSFFLSPYLIHKLKDGPYGVWVYAEIDPFLFHSL